MITKNKFAVVEFIHHSVYDVEEKIIFVGSYSECMKKWYKIDDKITSVEPYDSLSTLSKREYLKD